MKSLFNGRRVLGNDCGLENKPGEREKMDVSGRESGCQKMTGGADAVIFDRFFRVQKIDTQGDEKESAQESQVQDSLPISHIKPI